MEKLPKFFSSQSELLVDLERQAGSGLNIRGIKQSTSQ
jgi:hypothetical protein